MEAYSNVLWPLLEPMENWISSNTYDTRKVGWGEKEPGSWWINPTTNRSTERTMATWNHCWNRTWKRQSYSDGIRKDKHRNLPATSFQDFQTGTPQRSLRGGVYYENYVVLIWMLHWRNSILSSWFLYWHSILLKTLSSDSQVNCGI